MKKLTTFFIILSSICFIAACEAFSNGKTEELEAKIAELHSSLDAIIEIADDGEISAECALDEDYETINDALYECADKFSEIARKASY